MQHRTSLPADNRVSHEDWEAASPTPLMNRAALSVLSLGIFSVLLGLQIAWWAEEGLTARTTSMFLFGIGGLFVGRSTQVQLHERNAMAAVIYGGITFLSGLLWVVLLLLDGVFSLLALAVPLHAMLTTVLCALTLQPVRLADEARQRLRAQGYEP